MAPVSKAGEFLQAAEKLFFGKGTVAVAVDALEDGNHLLCTHVCYGFVRHGRYVHPYGQNLYFRAIACVAWPDPSWQSSLGTLRNHRLHNSQIMLSLSEKSGLTRSAAGRH